MLFSELINRDELIQTIHNKVEPIDHITTSIIVDAVIKEVDERWLKIQYLLMEG